MFRAQYIPSEYRSELFRKVSGDSRLVFWQPRRTARAKSRQPNLSSSRAKHFREGLRRTAFPYLPANRLRHRPCRLRLPRGDDRNHGRSAWADRTRLKVPFALWPTNNESVHLIAPLCQSRRIAAWSRGGRDTWWDKCRECREILRETR